MGLRLDGRVRRILAADPGVGRGRRPGGLDSEAAEEEVAALKKHTMHLRSPRQVIDRDGIRGR